jgi:AcrR family transcriptional regulator
MTREVDPTKKPALIEQVIDYLLDKPLSAVTFRSLATALGVSTFTLVYHFGTRAELVGEIIDAIANRQRGFDTVLDPRDVTIESYVEALRRTFELALLPRNRAMQRLEFEAQMFEALEAEHGATRAAHQELQLREAAALEALGLSHYDAAVESRLLVDTFYGIQVGLVVNGDDDRALAAFDRAIEYHQERVAILQARPRD